MKVISEKNIAASIVAFYIAKYNKDAIKHLHFSSFSEAFSKSAAILDVKKNYIKLRRDEFDPIYNWRKGWNNRPMSPIVCHIVELFDQLPELDLRNLVISILKNNKYPDLNLLFNGPLDTKEDSSYAMRLKTGRRAESFFREYHAQTSFPTHGVLEDCTEKGCGYDYLISNDMEHVYVEVKGITDEIGGIILTDKEWATAMEYGDQYYLCIVRNLDMSPNIQFIQNPCKNLNPTENIRTTIQITYSIAHGELLKYK